MALVVTADLERAIGAGEVVRYSKNNSAYVTQVIAEAESQARAEALNIYTAESWDAMTSQTIPAIAKGHIVWAAIGRLSAGSNRPESIDTMAAEAAKWRGLMATDHDRVFDGILTRNDVREDGASVTTQLGKTYLRRSDGESYLGLPEAE